MAVFYRTNAQSRVFEEVFIRVGLPYKVVGGVRFYERREVRDLLAYLRLIANPNDEVSLRRILNVPKRGIGERAEDYVAAFASRERISFAAALTRPGDVPGLAVRSAQAIERFNALIDGLRDLAAEVPAADLAEAVLDQSGYLTALAESNDLQDASRVENLHELVSVAREFDGQNEQGSLPDFLEQVSLVADADQIPEGAQHGGMVTLMTLHTAKGLEFPWCSSPAWKRTSSRTSGPPPTIRNWKRSGGWPTSGSPARCAVSTSPARWAGCGGRPSFHRQSRFLGEIPGSLMEWRRDEGAASAPAISAPRSGRGWTHPATVRCRPPRPATWLTTTNSGSARWSRSTARVTAPRRRLTSAPITGSSTWCFVTPRSKSCSLKPKVKRPATDGSLRPRLGQDAFMGTTRVVIAKPGLDGLDRGAKVVARALRMPALR